VIDPHAIRADGTLHADHQRCVIRFVRVLSHPVDSVWTAITDPAHLLEWWGDANAELRVGGAFVIRWRNTDDDGNTVTMHGTISALEPANLLEITGDVHGVLRFALRPVDLGTRLAFSSTVDLPAEIRTKILAGWHFHLDALATTLAGCSVDLAGLPGWPEIHQRYEERA
jgi:uncharacterized protein YndB with AHSA1/START domain